jgi:hypothetical protein
MINQYLKRRLTANVVGSVLIMAVIFSIVIVLLGTAYLKYVDFQRRAISYDIFSSISKLAAHANMIRGLAGNPAGGINYETEIEDFYEGEGYQVKYNYELQSTDEVQKWGFSTTTNFVIVGKGYVYSNEFGDNVIYSEVSHGASATSYADWLYITDRETQSYRPPGQDTIRFWGPDTLNGKVHSNDKLHFQARNGYWPVFWEKVTSCSLRFSPVNAPQYVEFNGGYQLGYQRLDFPIYADSVRAYNYYPGLGDTSSATVSEITLEPDYFIYRTRPATVGSRNQTSFAFPQNIYDAPHYAYPPTKALFIEGEVWITAAKGQLHYNHLAGDSLTLHGFRGQLTIAASGDIIIPQDVVYESSNPDGSVPMESMDVLGLISEKHILVWRRCSQTVKITAALGAIGLTPDLDSIPANRCSNGIMPEDGINGTISMDGINCYNTTNEKQQLTIWGCLIQRERGLIHTSYVGGLRGFISKDYKYDFRFRHMPPPHFFKTKARGNYYVERDYEDDLFQ